MSNEKSAIAFALIFSLCLSASLELGTGAATFPLHLITVFFGCTFYAMTHMKG